MSACAHSPQSSRAWLVPPAPRTVQSFISRLTDGGPVVSGRISKPESGGSSHPGPLSGPPAPSGIGGAPAASDRLDAQVTAFPVRSGEFPVVRPGFNQKGDLLVRCSDRLNETNRNIGAQLLDDRAEILHAADMNSVDAGRGRTGDDLRADGLQQYSDL